MELIIIGVCGPAGSNEKPLLLFDAIYTNYLLMANRTGRPTLSITRKLQDNGKFILPNIKEIEKIIIDKKPGAILVIPYDNPTGNFYTQDTLIEIAELCVKYNLWMISDEVYRELCYIEKQKMTSIWGLNNNVVPGIEGRRIGIESASKLWNACGLRIGAIITDNAEFHKKCVFEHSANLCASAIGQYIMGGIADLTVEELKLWFKQQRNYYKKMGKSLVDKFHNIIPNLIVSSPDASIYSVIDVRYIAKPNFNSANFVMFCAEEGKIELNGKKMTLLVAPMEGFYQVKDGELNPGSTQMRIAYVETPDRMNLIPELFKKLFYLYESKRN